MSLPAFNPVEIPDDERPDVTPITGGSFDPEFPGSTPDAPYGFKDDGTPYKRRPRGASGSKPASKRGVMPASDKDAAAAAAMLGKLNMLIAIGLNAAGMSNSGAAIMAGNDEFESMAKEALLTDPALCRKILGTGAVSGKAGLVMAYGMLGVSIFPAAKEEIQAKRAEREEEYNG